MHRVILLENDVNNQQTYRKALHGFECTVCESISSLDRFIRFDGVSWDLLITNLHLEDGDFFDYWNEVATKIKNRGPILVVTSSQDEELLMQCLGLEVEDFLLEPVSPIELALKVRNLIGKWQKSDGITVDPITLTVEHLEMTSPTLTIKEYQILRVLLDYSYAEISKEFVVRKIWKGVSVSEKTFNVHLCNLRRKVAKIDLCIVRSKLGNYVLSSSHNPAEIPNQNRDSKVKQPNGSVANSK